jgi:hypothetical protein
MTASTPSAAAHSRRVLILGHGGDSAGDALEFVARLGLEPSVMDVPSVERLDALRDASFALVLGAQELESPAMMLAVGFMLAVLGRQRICVLAPASQALPPALEGALRVAPDGEGLWQLLLAREMKRAGVEVDLNRAL